VAHQCPLWLLAATNLKDLQVKQRQAGELSLKAFSQSVKETDAATASLAQPRNSRVI
jgi:hypothetical protein